MSVPGYGDDPDCLSAESSYHRLRVAEQNLSPLMLTSRHIGRAFGALLLCLGGASALAQGGAADAKTFVHGLYARYGINGKGVDITGKGKSAIFAAPLLRLILKDQEQAQGEVGALGFDPICGCQDFDIRAVKVELRNADAKRASAVVAFRNFGKPQTMRLDLVKTPDGWRISDIHSASVPSLKKFLERALKDNI